MVKITLLAVQVGKRAEAGEWARGNVWRPARLDSDRKYLERERPSRSKETHAFLILFAEFVISLNLHINQGILITLTPHCQCQCQCKTNGKGSGSGQKGGSRNEPGQVQRPEVRHKQFLKSLRLSELCTQKKAW